MKIGKSLKIAMAKKEIKSSELAKGLGVSSQQVSAWINRGSMRCQSLIPVSQYFGLKVSEFIALGEDD